MGLPYATFFAFSTENWNRPRTEVEGLLRLLSQSVKRECAELHKHNVRIRHLGRLDNLPPNIARDITEAVALTAMNTGLNFSLAFNYGGRAEITDAVRRLAREGVPEQGITEEGISHRLYEPDLPDVDLVVRTAGESASPTFCYGSRPTPSSTPPKPCGPTSTAPRWIRRSPPSTSASGASEGYRYQ